MPKISTDTINAVNNVTDMVSLVENYTHLEKRGYTWWGCCPFHNEKTPSFQVQPDKKLFHCFGCNKGGGLLKFLMEIEHISFTEAVTRLADKSGIPVVYDGGNYKPSSEDKLKKDILDLYDKVTKSLHHILINTKTGKKALDYLTSRNVSPEIIEEFKLGFAPENRKWLFEFLKEKGFNKEFLSKTGLFSKKYPEIAFFSNRVMFPISNRHGQIIAFGGRTLSNDEKKPKYLNSSDMPQYRKKESLFGFNIAIQEIRKSKAALICEGYMDVLAFHQAGIKIAVAPLGTALTGEQIKMIRPFADIVYLAFDSDTAGQNASYKAINICAKLGIQTKIVSIKNGKDPADILLKDGAEGLIFIFKNAIITADYLIQIALTRFGSTPDGKLRACRFLFPYLEALDSDIKRESTIAQISATVGISQSALYSDYKNRVKQTWNAIVQDKDITDKIDYNAEMRAVLAVVANTDLFKMMRSELTADDFENLHARELFIILEECYRDDALICENILAKCQNDSLRNAITKTVTKGEFTMKAKEIVSDGINYVKSNILQKKRENLLGKLRLLNVTGNVEDSNLADELMLEIRNIDNQIIKFKGRTV
ncbi:MAG: DNA primase [Treponema sp.]|nr:MAG: DNA primase [Treponema sp.]